MKTSWLKYGHRAVNILNFLYSMADYGVQLWGVHSFLDVLENH